MSPAAEAIHELADLPRPGTERDRMSSEQEQDAVQVVFAGHLDHGKSTLIGRLRTELGLPHERAAGAGLRESAFAMDQLAEEQRDGMTLETAQVCLRLPERVLVLIDVPGHRELLHNTLTGVSHATAAVLVVDAAEGIRDQTRRHARVLALLGVPLAAVAVNKMDLCGFDRHRFDEVSTQVAVLLRESGAGGPSEPAVIPVSGRTGDNVVTASGRMPWHHGPTLLGQLLSIPAMAATDDTPRLPIQDVYRVNGETVVVGTLLSGCVREGDWLELHPAGGTCRVVSVRRFPSAPGAVMAGEAAGLVLDGPEPLRGMVLAGAAAGVACTHSVLGRVFWLSAGVLREESAWACRCATQVVPVTVTAVRERLDAESLDALPPDRGLHQYELGLVELRAVDAIVCTGFGVCPGLGRFALEDSAGHPVAAGVFGER